MDWTKFKVKDKELKDKVLNRLPAIVVELREVAQIHNKRILNLCDSIVSRCQQCQGLNGHQLENRR